MAARKKSAKKMTVSEELENMVLSFRVSELQMLLGSAGRKKSGRKNELQERALELLRLRSYPAIPSMIRESYKAMQADKMQAHQASMPPAPRTNPVYPTADHTIVTLQNMVLSFRVSELQMLLGFAGRKKSGLKNELQERALELLRLRSYPAIPSKIRDKAMQADQMQAYQMYGQTGNSSESQFDQNMHNRNYYTRQAISQQQQQQSPVSAGKELPQAPRTNPVYPTAGYTSVAPQLSKNICLRRMKT